MRWIRATLVCLVAPVGVIATASAAAFDLSGLPPYRPTRAVQGTIRSWGHGFLRPLMHLWAEDFRRFQPGVRFETRLVTSASAIAGLYTGSVNLGVLAREILPSEAAAYEKMTRQKLTPVTVLMGSYGNQDKIMALGIFVNRDNPLAQLTFSQLDAIWGAELRGGAHAPVRTWDQVGLTGVWAGRPIQPYTGLAFEAPAAFFSHRVMGGSVLWNDALRQFENSETERPSTGSEPTAPQIRRTVDAYQKVVDAVGADPAAIGLSGAGYRNPRAKLVAVAAGPEAPFVVPSAETISDQTYPLARPVKFYLNAGPMLPADPVVIEFLRYVLSRDGQSQVLHEGDFLPLSAETARAEREKLP